MIRAIDGFDHYGAAADLQRKARGIVWSTTTFCSVQTPGTRGLGKCINIQSPSNAPPSNLTGALTANYTEGFFEFDMTVAANGVNVNVVTVTIVDFSTGGTGTTQGTVEMDQAGAAIRVFNAAGTLVGFKSGAFIVGSAFKFGIGLLVSSSAGYIAVRVNNQAVLNITGLNTEGGANAFFNGITVTTPSGYAGCLIDNFTFCDTVAGPGTYPTDTFLGMTRVNTLFPTGNGATTQWTPAAGANWQEVNATAFNGGTTYNATATDGATDLLVMQSLTGTVSTVIAVQLTGAYEADAAGPLAAKHLISNGSTVATGSSMAIGLDYAFLSDIAEVNPITSGAWTAGQVNSYTFGYELVVL